MIDNPQVGQEVVIWSHLQGALMRATVTSEVVAGMIGLEIEVSSGKLHISRPASSVCTLDDALPLLLWEAAGHNPGEENEHHGRTH